MKRMIMLAVMVNCFTTCSKKNEEPPNNNEFNATVVFSTGEKVTILAKGKDAKMGSSAFAGVTHVSGINENGAVVFINIFPIVTAPGTYSFDCEYRPNMNVSNTPTYSGVGGNITFTIIDAGNMKGFFTNVVCKCISANCINNVDSLTVSGSFTGNYLN